MLPMGVPAVIGAYVECWKYFALNLVTKAAAAGADAARLAIPDPPQFQQRLLQRHLLPVCLYFVLNQHIRAPAAAFCDAFGLLLAKLNGHAMNKHMVGHFWRPLLQSVLQALKEDKDKAPPHVEPVPDESKKQVAYGGGSIVAWRQADLVLPAEPCTS